MYRCAFQVLQSWWVVSSEIKRLSRSGRKADLVMSNGSKAPVSSRFKSALEELLSFQNTEIPCASLH
ncbi:LytTR family transcriptional regulator DNA-binding domain-containing protein [Parasphingorhabdus cellanae]|uniref:LytTR family transcriptional regulator DNA-binding domain-containing protein n=1 Tax=Parasphingorhabdus cellanae TaxID=2806553 RepID=A0ABX7T818_9SPHN|nr:LytTR family transcriptional regulator DNA-binding domain-containing protein [Parasphingorhabdus cellanae]